MISLNEKLALKDFAEIVKQHDVPFVLIGASARLLVLDWKYKLQSERTTIDWDITSPKITNYSVPLLILENRCLLWAVFAVLPTPL